MKIVRNLTVLVLVFGVLLGIGWSSHQQDEGLPKIEINDNALRSSVQTQLDMLTTALDDLTQESNTIRDLIEQMQTEIANLRLSVDEQAQVIQSILQQIEELRGPPPPSEIEFQVYHSLGFWGETRPEITESGATWMPMLHNSACRDEPFGSFYNIASQDKINAAIDRIGLPVEYNGRLVIDYEPYVAKIYENRQEVGDEPWDHDRAMAAYTLLLERVRVRLPEAEIAFFGIPTISILVDGQRVKATAAEFTELWPLVDFLAPQFYTSSLTWNATQETRVRTSMQDCMTAGKPVFPVITPKQAGDDDPQWIPIEALISRVAACKDEGAESVVMWDSASRYVNIDPWPVWGSYLTALVQTFEESEPIGFVPDLTPGIMFACGGGVRSESNPYGLREFQWRSEADARAFVQRQYARAEVLWQANPNVRVIWHQPAGWDADMRGSMVTAATVNGAAPNGSGTTQLYPWRWSVFVEETTAFLQRCPGARLGIYQSGQIPQSAASVDDELVLPWEAYDHEDPRHREIMLDLVISPLLDLGFTEFWFDWTSSDEGRGDIVELAMFLRQNYDVKAVMEAFPTDAEGQLDPEVLSEMPACALHRFVLSRESRLEGDWRVPEGSEVIVLLSNHTQPGIERPTQADLEHYLSLGMVPFSMNEAYDLWILDLLDAQGP